MAKKRTKLSDEIRQAVDASGMSRYAICKQLGILQSSLSRFMSGKGGLTMASLDALAELLDLHLATDKRRQSKKG
jgi:transcriptional regulator with XRE-family HTH domain